MLRNKIRGLIAPLLSRNAIGTLKTTETKFKRWVVHKSPPISREQLRSILRDRLKVRVGSSVMVHAAFSMLNTKLKPIEILDELLAVVGPTGHVAAPTFCRGLALDYMEADKPFDVRSTPTGMGALAEAVWRHPQSVRSLHPTKSVAVIGPRAHWITETHHLDRLPFGLQSPFARLIELDCIVIGIGVTMSYLSMVHAPEESGIEFPLKVNLPTDFFKKCIAADGSEHLVATKVHDINVLRRADPERFVKSFVEPADHVIYSHFFSPFFSVRARALNTALAEQSKHGKTIYF